MPIQTFGGAALQDAYSNRLLSKYSPPPPHPRYQADRPICTEHPSPQRRNGPQSGPDTEGQGNPTAICSAVKKEQSDAHDKLI